MSRTTRWITALAGVIVGSSMLATGASAADLDEPFTPFSHCPVDDPALGGAPPTTFGAACVSSLSESGSITIGSTEVVTGRTEMQIGVTGVEGGEPLVVPAADGMTLQSDTVTVPGGLLGLDLPENNNLGALLNRLLSGPPLGVKATVELVGTPSDFDGNAALGSGESVITLPVRVHLQNAVLGNRCYIGSAQEPIVLKPQLSTAPADQSVGFFTGGFVVGFTATLVDDTFTVPRARGCGPLNLLDKVINAKLGLPSPSGANTLVLDDTRLSVALTQQGGQILADAWHAAVTSP